MCNERCYIVPPHLLQAIADSTSNPEKVRETAKASLLAREKVSLARTERFAALTQPRGYAAQQPARQQIVPPHILRAISTAEDNDEATRERAKDNLEHVEGVINQFKASQGMVADASPDSDDDLLTAVCRHRTRARRSGS